MRLTPAQIAMLQLLGEPFWRGPEQTLLERIRSGREFLIDIAGQDFGFDPQRWHEYLRETDAGGYKWSNKHLGMPKRIKAALENPEWRQAVEELRREGEKPLPMKPATVVDVVPALSVTQEQLREYREEGYVLLSGLISPEVAETLRREVMGIMEVIGLGTSKLRQTHEYLEGSALDAFVNSENLRSIAAALMEGPATLYMPFTAVKSGAARAGESGGGEFHFHQDNQYTHFDGPGINLWFALTPMTEESGCLRMVPRSNLHGTLPSEQSPDKDGHKTVTFQPEEFVPVLMQPGDCVAFSRLTVHGSGPNATTQPRVAYAVQFHRDDVNFSLDGGQTWTHLKENPRWNTAPVKAITPPKGKLDGH